MCSNTSSSRKGSGGAVHSPQLVAVTASAATLLGAVTPAEAVPVHVHQNHFLL